MGATDKINHGFRDLIVYQKSYKLALEVFEYTRLFPKDEKYGLVDQIRRLRQRFGLTWLRIANILMMRHITH